jgi:hypothetical protein
MDPTRQESSGFDWVFAHLLQRFFCLKGLSHEMYLAFDDMYGYCSFRPKQRTGPFLCCKKCISREFTLA